MKILLIIPVYNEEKNILNVFEKIIDYNKNHKEKYDYIFINDGSSDLTNKILDEKNINHIDLIRNLGIGGAVQTGYKYAFENDYDIAVQFDGDGQHDINYVKNIVDPIAKDNINMCIGSRFILPNKEGFKSSKARRVGIKIISSFIKICTGKKIYDPTSGFRAVDKSIIEFFSHNYPTEYPEPVSETIILKKNLSIEEVPVVMLDRTNGISSIRSWRNIYYMVNVLLSILVASIRRY